MHYVPKCTSILRVQIILGMLRIVLLMFVCFILVTMVGIELGEF
jgi:hypothetical protein